MIPTGAPGPTHHCARLRCMCWLRETFDQCPPLRWNTREPHVPEREDDLRGAGRGPPRSGWVGHGPNGRVPPRTGSGQGAPMRAQGDPYGGSGRPPRHKRAILLSGLYPSGAGHRPRCTHRLGSAAGGRGARARLPLLGARWRGGPEPPPPHPPDQALGGPPAAKAGGAGRAPGRAPRRGQHRGPPPPPPPPPPHPPRVREEIAPAVHKPLVRRTQPPPPRQHRPRGVVGVRKPRMTHDTCAL